MLIFKKYKLISSLNQWRVFKENINHRGFAAFAERAISFPGTGRNHFIKPRELSSRTCRNGGGMFYVNDVFEPSKSRKSEFLQSLSSSRRFFNELIIALGAYCDPVFGWGRDEDRIVFAQGAVYIKHILIAELVGFFSAGRTLLWLFHESSLFVVFLLLGAPLETFLACLTVNLHILKALRCRDRVFRCFFLSAVFGNFILCHAKQ